MSESVCYKGKLKDITDRYVSLDLQCKVLCEDAKIDKKKWHDDYIDTVRYELEDEYVIVKERIFKIIKKDYIEDFNWFIAKKKDDVVEFDVAYYNGGCSFEEAIETAISNIKED